MQPDTFKYKCKCHPLSV